MNFWIVLGGACTTRHSSQLRQPKSLVTETTQLTAGKSLSLSENLKLINFVVDRGKRQRRTIFQIHIFSRLMICGDHLIFEGRNELWFWIKGLLWLEWNTHGQAFVIETKIT